MISLLLLMLIVAWITFLARYPSLPGENSRVSRRITTTKFVGRTLCLPGGESLPARPQKGIGMR
jgi:hypothetical protein